MDIDRLGAVLDLVPYRHAPLLEAALGKHALVLDLGGGTGRVARRLVFGRVLVCDPAKRLILRARKKGLEVVRCDARALPFRDATAGGAIAVDALHHMPDAAGVLAEAARVLMPGGRLVVEEFDPASWGGRAVWRVETFLGFGSKFWSPDQLATLARTAGFLTHVERWSRRDYALVALSRPERSKSQAFS